MSNYPHHTNPRLLDLFEEPSLRETFRRVVEGLKQPHHTGAYKWARFQMQRLLSPASAVVVPCFLLLLISLLAATHRDTIPVTGAKILPKTLPQPELEKTLDPIEPEPDTQTIKGFDTVSTVTTPTPSAVERPPAAPVFSTIPVPGAQPVRSPVMLPAVYQARGDAAKGDPGGGGTSGNGPGPSHATECAVLNALRWLKSVQESDGSWLMGSGGGPKYGSGVAPAATGLALLAYLAHGETPASLEFGGTVQRALEWLGEAQEADGRFKGRDPHDYSHPIATFALCEAYGMTRNPLLAPMAERAVRVLIAGQNVHGGWTYNCKPETRNDLSYTGWCVQALKAAHIARVYCEGLDEALRRAEDGLCHNADPEGSFGYTGPGVTHLTAVGVLGLQLLGYHRKQMITRGLAALDAAHCSWAEPMGKSPLYYWYYITQAKRLAGGKQWVQWNRQFSREFVKNQIVLRAASPDGKDIGYWEAASTAEHCRSRVYNTTLCTLSLEVYYKIGGHFEPPPDDVRNAADRDDDLPLTVINI